MSGKALVRVLGIVVAMVGALLIFAGFQRDIAAGACSSDEPGETQCGSGPGDPLLFSGFAGLPAGVLGAIFLPYAMGRAAERRIRRTGRDATATVLASRKTGVEVAGRPQVELVVGVEPADGSPTYRAVVRTYLSGFGVPRPGDRVPVRTDPADPSRIALLTGVPGTPAVEASASDPPYAAIVDELSRLAGLHRAGELTDAEYEALKRRVLNGPG